MAQNLKARFEQVRELGGYRLPLTV